MVRGRILRGMLVASLLLQSVPALADEDQPEDQYLRDAHVDILNGNFDRAIKTYEKLLKKNPRSKEAWFGIGDVYFHQFKYGETIFPFGDLCSGAVINELKFFSVLSDLFIELVHLIIVC